MQSTPIFATITPLYIKAYGTVLRSIVLGPGKCQSRSMCFIRTPLAIGPANLRLMPWRKPASAAGAITGCSISTLRASSIASTGSFCSRRSANIRTVACVLLYIERWPKGVRADGRWQRRTATGGNATGGVISPLLANLFLHYALDKWMAREFPHIPFERYADDVICHCRTKEDARVLWRARLCENARERRTRRMIFSIAVSRWRVRAIFTLGLTGLRLCFYTKIERRSFHTAWCDCRPLYGLQAGSPS